MQNDEKAILGVKFISDRLTAEGYTVINRPQGETGYDILAEKDGKKIRIEIKTTGNLKGGIPDMHDTEFKLKDGHWYFVADQLYILRLDENFNPIQLDILDRDDVDQFAASHTTVTRIRTSKLQRALFKGSVGRTVNL